MNNDFKREFDEMQSQGWRIMPFGELFKDNVALMGTLEDQFNAAPLKRSYYKYIRKDISDKELQEDHGKKNIGYSSEMDARLQALINECDTLHASGKLNKKYYVNDIEQTNIVIQLKAIGDKYKMLQDYIVKHGNSEPINLKTETEAIGKQIIADVNAIAYHPLRKMVVEYILNDTENIGLTVESMVSGWQNKQYEDAGRTDNYKRLKMYFDNYLRENFNHNIKNAPVKLDDLFKKDKARVSIIREAIKDLNITNSSSERNVTGFIDAAKQAGAFPLHVENTTLLRIIYKEIEKPFTDKTKPRYDLGAYTNYFRLTKKYFGIK